MIVPNMVIFLMTKNEKELIEDWLKYHGYLFGFANLNVIDGSDDPEIDLIYQKYIEKGVTVHKSKTNLNGLAEELTRRMREFNGKNKFLIKLDTDEFLAHTYPTNLVDRPFSWFRPIARLRGLTTLRFHKSQVSKVKKDTKAYQRLAVSGIRGVVASLPISHKRYKLLFCTFSIPKQRFQKHPARSITKFSQVFSSDFKSFFHSDSFVSVDLGSHQGESFDNDGFIETGLAIIHFHATSVEDSMRRAKRVLVSHEYIEHSDPIETQMQKLSELYDRPILSSHRIKMYFDYLSSIQASQEYDIAKLREAEIYHLSLDGKLGMGSCEITLVRDTLDKIDAILDT